MTLLDKYMSAASAAATALCKGTFNQTLLWSAATACRMLNLAGHGGMRPDDVLQFLNEAGQHFLMSCHNSQIQAASVSRTMRTFSRSRVVPRMKAVAIHDEDLAGLRAGLDTHVTAVLALSAAQLNCTGRVRYRYVRGHLHALARTFSNHGHVELRDLPALTFRPRYRRMREPTGAPAWPPVGTRIVVGRDWLDWPPANYHTTGLLAPWITMRLANRTISPDALEDLGVVIEALGRRAEPWTPADVGTSLASMASIYV